MKKLFILLLLVTNISIKADSLMEKKSDVDVKSITTELSEGQAYKMLYDNQLKFNDAILKTIYYALGGLATAILAVFASNWWFNEKKVKDVAKGIDLQIADAKKTALSEVIDKLNSFSLEKTSEISQRQTKLQEEVTSSITGLTLKFNDLSEKLRIEIREDNKVLLGNYQKQLDSFNENYRQQISTLNENINNQVNSLKDVIKSSKEQSDNEVNEIKKIITRVEFYMWDHRGIMINAMRAQVRELKLVQEKSKNDHANYPLFLTQLLGTLGKMTYIYVNEKQDLIETIKKIPAKHDILKNSVLEAVGKIKIEENG